VSGQLGSLRFRITKRSGAKTVLNDFALEVRGRQFVTLLGPSGCGKSTALNIVAGLIPASDGELWIDGERMDHLPTEKRGFGMVFQNYALFPHMTVFGNVAFGLELQRKPTAEVRERVGRMLHLVQLPGFEDRFPSQLSGGQQQRVAIARALVMHPRLMLFDEPLSNLDAKLRVEMRAEIKRIHTSLGLTCIYVTHDQTEALSLSDWVVVMRDGVVLQAGPPQVIYDRPDNVFVADFMGFRNFFSGEVAAVGPEGQVELASGPLRVRGRARHALALGERATAAIRPEDVQVGGGPRGLSEFGGKVEIVEYLGRDNEAVLTLEGGSSLWVRTPAHLSPGETVPVVFPPDKVLLLPSSADAGPT
jgi:putative spermidine/putrescine transport system ATP-binding protein